MLYSKSTANSSVSDLVKDYNNRAVNFFSLYISQFLLFEKLFNEFNKKEKIISKKNYENDSSGIIKIILKNEILLFFKDYKKLKKLKLKFEIDIWDKNIKIIESLFDEIYNSELFEKYESLDNLNFENRKQIVIDIFKKIIVKNEFLYQLYEDEELGWVDDFPLVNTLFLNYLKSYNESKKNNIPLKIFSDKEDKKFGLKLFKSIINNDNELDKIISEFTPEWENERIAVIDLIILKMCLTEFLNFPSIPVKVSINEYIEISKNYSSPESSNFINGVSNNVFKNLKEKELIKKNERGSQ